MDPGAVADRLHRRRDRRAARGAGAHLREPRGARLSTGFIQIFQGTPLLLQLFLIFFGAPVLGLDINPWIAAGVALVAQQPRLPRRDLARLHPGHSARPVGGCQALGLHYARRMRDVVLPQAFKIALPPTVGYMVQIIKGTSLAAIIGFTEVTRAGQIINNATFQPLHRVHHRGGDLLRHVLAAVAAGRAHGEAQAAALAR